MYIDLAEKIHGIHSFPNFACLIYKLSTTCVAFLHSTTYYFLNKIHHHDGGIKEIYFVLHLKEMIYLDHVILRFITILQNQNTSA